MSGDLPSPFSLSLGATDDRASFDEETTTLFRAFSSRLIWFLRRRFGEQVAQDATQEAFMRLHRARRGGTRIDYPKTWVSSVAVNAAIDQTRRSRLNVPLTVEIEVVRSVAAYEPIDTAEQRCWQQQRLARLKQEISQLSDVERTCLFMRAKGSTYEAIGVQVSLDYRRVAELVGRVIKKLRASVGDASLFSRLNG
jgi:RNA polymerase sigma factor (sigma-70 family)